MTFHIRPLALEQDLNNIHQLTAQLGYPSTLENIQQRWQQIHQNPHYHTLVIDHDATVIGYAGFIEQYSWEFDGGFLRIQAFVIHEDYRGQGLGKKLMDAVEQQARQHGFKRIMLNSGNRIERYPAHAFYQRLGFDAYSLGFSKLLN